MGNQAAIVSEKDCLWIVLAIYALRFATANNNFSIVKIKIKKTSSVANKGTLDKKSICNLCLLLNSSEKCRNPVEILISNFFNHFDHAVTFAIYCKTHG